MQGPTRSGSFNLEAKGRESHASQFKDEQRSILIVGLDPFCRLFNDTGDETPCATAISKLLTFGLSTTTAIMNE
jgi:hypothetical protein